jgi:hypothetical protein
MLSITELFTKFRRSPHLAAVTKLTPVLAGATLAQNFPPLSIMVNLATCFILWWRARARSIYRLTPNMALWLQTINLNFVPETPPAGWVNGTIIIESMNKTALVGEAWSIAAYYLEDTQGHPRYFFCYLQGEGAYSFSIYADLGNLNAKLIDTGQFLAANIWQEGDGRFFVEPALPEQQNLHLEIVKFVFATSYFTSIPQERLEITWQPGPPARNDRGKVVKRGGKIVPLWSYQNLLRYLPPSPPAEHRDPLDKEGLALEPVIVRPYLRRSRVGVVVFVETHDSHRWKRLERIGKKITL